MYVNPEIFKAYDIRGIFPEEINGKTSYLVARAFAEHIRGKSKLPLRIIVAADARPSSPEIKKGVIEGLLDEGVEVIDMGLATTPQHYFTVVQSGADGGMMVTASHNAYRTNGLKFTKKGGEQIGEGLEVMRQMVRRSIFQNAPTRGKLAEVPVTREYIEYLVSKVDLSGAKDLKIICDAGGGMTSLLIPQMIRNLPCKITVMNGDLAFDMMHEPLNPAREESLAPLKNAVLEARADFGIAFDPDGDRCGIVTGNARYFRPDYVAAFFAREFLKTNEGAAIVYDVRSSNIFRETIMAHGGRALESRVGHRFIKELMRKEDAIFAGELSGHFYFKEAFYMDSDFLPMFYMMQFLTKLGKTADEVLDEFAIYPSSGELSFKVKPNENYLEQIAAHYKDAKEVRWVDGLSVYYEDWWANVRQSNTEPVVRINVEARTREVLNEKVEELKKLLGV
ncbi:MAG: phosphomannomutase/phosphoglucomutase [Patescibacteria group bacterium]